jgi:GNAT superfamily N-acetyltransferase
MRGRRTVERSGQAGAGRWSGVSGFELYECRSAADEEDALRLRNEEHDYDPLTLEEQRESDAVAKSAVRIVRFVGRDASGRAVGRGVAVENALSGGESCYLELTLRPGEFDLRRWNDGVDVLEAVATSWGCVDAVLMETDRATERIEAAQGRGYGVAQRNPMSSLDLTAFRSECFVEAKDRLEAQEIRIESLDQFALDRGDAWRREFWRLETDLLEDVPMPSPPQEMPFERFEPLLLSPQFTLHTRFLALHGDRPIGMSEFRIGKADPTQALTRLTGVRREYRRRGIALALKAAALERARTLGVRTIWTDNEESNPMYVLNQRLGFQKAWDWVHLSRPLQP